MRHEIRLPTPAEWSTAEWHEPRAAVDHLAERHHASRMDKAAKMVVELADELGAEVVVDVGAGAGGVLRLVQLARPELELLGYEWHAGNRALARERYNLALTGADVTKLAEVGGLVSLYRRAPAIIVATELLEHLDDPHKFVRELRSDRNIVGLVASSPWNENEQHYSEGHRWAWDVDGYRELLERRLWRVVAHEVVDWSQVIAAVPQRPEEGTE